MAWQALTRYMITAGLLWLTKVGFTLPWIAAKAYMKSASRVATGRLMLVVLGSHTGGGGDASAASGLLAR
jgi:hypothetical protein